MNFKKIELYDAELLKPYLTDKNELTCEISFVNLLLWQPLYNNCYCIEDGILYLKSYSDYVETYSLPFGDIEKGMQKIMSCSSQEYPVIWAQAGKRFDEFKSIYGDYYDITESRNEFDYIYNAFDLINLSGKKYHSKRNHISFFMKNYNWSYEEINQDNIGECIAMNEKWYELNVDKDPIGIDAERKVLEFSFENFRKFGFIGGILKIDGEVVAFTLGEKLNDNVFVTHFEKAFSAVRGAYPMINNQFALNSLNDFEFVNREDDLGSEGLRKAKLSYYPEILLEKYTAVKI